MRLCVTSTKSRERVMKNKIFKKSVSRNKETGFPIPNQEDLIINRSALVMVITCVVFTALIFWRKNG